MTLLAITHTIICETKDKQVVYNASSPDELALVNFAKFCGFEYLGLDEENQACVNIMNTMHYFKLLYTLEFNSTRKRNSVIIKNKNNEIVLYCKGADSIIYERLKDKKYLIFFRKIIKNNKFKGCYYSKDLEKP